MAFRRATVLTLLGVALCASCAPTRPVQPEADLLAQRSILSTGEMTEAAAATERMLQAVRARYEAARARGSTEPPTVDVLSISGGGDFGAFAAGYLKGWGKVTAAGFQRPTFDVVLGVSTGALIAPFAYLGTDAAYDEIVDLYRNPKPDWVVSRGMLYFLPSNISFAEVPGLERDLRAHVTTEFVERLAAADRTGRIVFVNTTNLDDGSPRAWNLGAVAEECCRSESIEKVHQVMLASAGIPGAFPARTIDGGLYVDGGVTSNMIYGGRIKEANFLPAQWARIAPDLPPLRIRYWVLFNNWLESPARTVQPTWPPVVSRSLEVAVRASTITALRHLFTLAELTNLRGPGTMEVRLVAIPAQWRPPVEGVFKVETMADLADLGEKMGADPGSWLPALP